MGPFGTTDKRPQPGDDGKRVWAWILPGNHPSQIVTGVLKAWSDDGDLQMDDGKLYMWSTIKVWGFGDPPKPT